MDENNKKSTKKKKKLEKILITLLFILIGIIVMISIINIGIYYYEDLTTMGIDEKPIIYLYPEQTTELSVTLGNPENITCSYPKYNKDGWQVVANPDGTLINKDTGKSLYALYWEGKSKKLAKFEDGFVVKKEETVNFLEEKLAILGLNEREAEEFIIYWLPKLQENKYNLIRFETMDEINEEMPLKFSVQPDTIIRVMMDWKGLDKPINVKEQTLYTPERKGFVAVEWGGRNVMSIK